LEREVKVGPYPPLAQDRKEAVRKGFRLQGGKPQGYAAGVFKQEGDEGPQISLPLVPVLRDVHPAEYRFRVTLILKGLKPPEYRIRVKA
jgi:hypothetical protein